MIRPRPSRRSIAAFVAAVALLAGACELEPVPSPPPDTTGPLEGALPATDAPPVDDAAAPDEGHGHDAHGADAPEEGESDPYPPTPNPPASSDPKATPGGGEESEAPEAPEAPAKDATTPPAPAPDPPAEAPDDGDDADDASGGHSGHGAPYVNSSAIPSGSGGTGSALVGPTDLTPLTDDIQGALVMVCRFSHMNFDDAIVFPGVRNATHLHAYFGNTGADFASTPESIRGSGNSTCLGGTANRSSYWVPALIDTRDGTPLAPTEMVTYYTHGRVPGSQIQPQPAGLRILAGNARSTGAQQYVRWWCPGDHGHYESYISPNCNADEELKLSVTFPQCWNGRDTHSADQSHMAYPGWNTGCPSSHPIAVPQVNLNVIWHLDGQPPSALRLSSDMYSHDVPGGYSGHADWFDGWDREILETWVSECVNRAVYCFGGNLGNGQALQRR